MDQPIVGAVQATNAAVIQNLAGDVIFKMADRPASEFILEFDLDAKHFVGRSAVFAALDLFTAQNPSGYFEIVADAGLGKTALAAEIARRKNAIAFYASVGSGTGHPEQFLAHVSAELLARYRLGPTSLPPGVGDSSVILSRYLREAVKRSVGVPVWIVVDGLDEAEAVAIGANPLLLPLDVPPGVFVVVTRRTGSLVAGPETAVRRYELHRDDLDQQKDVEALLWDRIERDERIQNALAQRDMAPGDLVAALTNASDGNFMYLSYVLADIVDGDGPQALDLTALPHGLAGYYDQVWGRITALRDEDWATWGALYRPVLERFAVSYEAVSADWLAQQVGRPAEEIQARVLESWARVLSATKQRTVTTWRFVHRTFSDYLGESDRVDLVAAHAAVAESYVDRRWDHFDEWDAYGLRHATAHLASAAVGQSGAGRHESVVKLTRLVVNERFIQRQLIAQDPYTLERNLMLAVRMAAADEMSDATFHVVPVVLALLRFRRQLLQPFLVFQAAGRGEVGLARRLLQLWGENLDPDWQTALTLAIAWLAGERAPKEASALRDEIRARMDADLPAEDMNVRLLHHVSAALDGSIPVTASVSGPPDVRVAQEIMERLAGGGPRSSLYRDLSPSSSAGEYFAGEDGDSLVALVAGNPEVGQPFFRAYVEFHATYGYPQYRSNSLRHLLAAVLRHPDQTWVRDQLPEIGMALMAPVGGEFVEGLEVALLARQALCNDEDATLELALRAEAEITSVGTLPTAGATASPSEGSREVGDVWATDRRRLAALAEAAWLHPFTNAMAGQLLDAAVTIDGGFAGYAAPAYLTLAEAVSIVDASDVELRVAGLLMRALQAAHNIRDPLFALRMTARVNAMRERWWPTPTTAELAAAVRSLSEEPGAPEFAALHKVGEKLSTRLSDVPASFASALTLRQIAGIHQRPLSELARLNPSLGRDLDAPLELRTRVNIPDPTFASMLAARFAAGMLAAAGLTSHPGETERRADDAVIRRLVPVAAGDATSLATTLGRLVLATPTDDRATLDELRKQAPGASPAPSGSGPTAAWG